jgi:hypothetical protein
LKEQQDAKPTIGQIGYSKVSNMTVLLKRQVGLAKQNSNGVAHDN